MVNGTETESKKMVDRVGDRELCLIYTFIRALVERGGI